MTMKLSRCTVSSTKAISLRGILVTLLLVFVIAVPNFGVAAASSDDDDDDDDVEDAVSCGSVVKITNVESGYDLNSENKSLNSGSGQQIVTFVKDKGTHNTLWSVRPADEDDDREYTDESTCQLGAPIRCGTEIRLTHLETQKNLHSHGVPSILSNQQEVTAFGEGDGRGDGGDNWKIECADKSSKYWKRKQVFRLHHSDTGKYLGTSRTVEFNQKSCGSQCPIMGHLESFGRSNPDKHTQMKVYQGVHLSL